MRYFGLKPHGSHEQLDRVSIAHRDTIARGPARSDPLRAGHRLARLLDRMDPPAGNGTAADGSIV